MLKLKNMIRRKKLRHPLERDVELLDISDQFEAEVETLLYDIFVPSLNRVVGRCEFRNEVVAQELEYYGNIGYVIYLPYRGNHFAYKACLKLFDLLRQQRPEFQELIITCNPDNEASQKTIHKLGAEYLKTVDIAAEHPLHKQGEFQKEVYRIAL